MNTCSITRTQIENGREKEERKLFQAGFKGEAERLSSLHATRNFRDLGSGLMVPD